MKTPHPYTQIRKGGFIIREFHHKTNPEEFVWHKDRLNRKVKILNGHGWQLQFENALPFDLIEGHIYDVPSMMWHRIIPGNNSLKIQIYEEKENRKMATRITESRLRSIVKSEIMKEASYGYRRGQINQDAELKKYIDAIGAEAVLEIYLQKRETTNDSAHAVRLTLAQLRQQNPDIY